MQKIKTSSLDAAINPKKGLALESVVFKKVSSKPLIGTLHHGYYDDIAFGADFYSGHVVMEAMGKPKITDLVSVPSSGFKANIETEYGIIQKSWQAKQDTLILSCDFDLCDVPPAPFHVGFVTMFPEAFDRKTLYYACHNGGTEKEVFPLRGVESVDIHPVSFLVSSRYVLGNTEGELEIGDARKRLIMQNDMAQLAMLPVIQFVDMGSTYFLRVIYSLREVDDTNAQQKSINIKSAFQLRISAK
jgi:hypothetical protein